MTDFAWVMFGCALGGVSRYWLSGAVGRRVGETFPWGTMAVNGSGALAIGIVAAASASGHAWFSDTTFWRFAGIGFLGSYTTVSSFSLQTLALARDGQGWRAAVNVLASLVLCLSAAGFGLLAGGRLIQRLFG
jgi:fluoride exporter